MDPREGLSIANLVFYVPCLCIAAWVTFRHGFSRQAGWIFLILLAFIRVLGSICQIVSVNSPSESIDEAWIILSSVGLSPLLLAMLGLLVRVHQNMSPASPIHPMIFRILAVAPIIAVILAIVGGSQEAENSDPSKVSTGTSLVQAGVIIFMVTFLIFAAITLATFLRLRSISVGEQRVLYAVALSIPFIFVRLIYSIIVDFAGNSQFNLITGDVVIQACMASLMEFIVVILYLGAGLVAPKIAKSNVQPSVALAETGYTGQQAGQQYTGQTNSQYTQQQSNPSSPDQQYMNTKPQNTSGGRRGRRVQGPIHYLINRYT